MQHNFKVGDKVKVKPYDEFDFSDVLYDGCQDDVQVISDKVFEILDIDKDGDLYLNTADIISFDFYVHPDDVVLVTTISSKKPRPHAELIKQWADDDSLEIEVSSGADWYVTKNPEWHEEQQYRIKPKKVTKWKWAYNSGKTDTTLITTDYFASEDELKEGRVVEKAIKLDWTAKEFEI